MNRSRRVLIIAHRGASAVAPENTIAAFEQAIAVGADMVELDVRRTRDRVLVVHHDEHIAEEPICQLSYAEVLAHKSSVPTLPNVLQITAGKIGLNLELKETGYELDVFQLLQQCDRVADSVITSFHESSVRVIQQHCPAVRSGLLLHSTSDIEQLYDLRADVLALHWSLGQPKLLERLRAYTSTIYLWTVNEPEQLREILVEGLVDGIITDVPEVALSLRRSLSD